MIYSSSSSSVCESLVISTSWACLIRARFCFRFSSNWLWANNSWSLISFLLAESFWRFIRLELFIYSEEILGLNERLVRFWGISAKAVVVLVEPPKEGFFLEMASSLFLGCVCVFEGEALLDRPKEFKRDEFSPILRDFIDFSPLCFFLNAPYFEWKWGN